MTAQNLRQRLQEQGANGFSCNLFEQLQHAASWRRLLRSCPHAHIAEGVPSEWITSDESLDGGQDLKTPLSISQVPAHISRFERITSNAVIRREGSAL